MKPPVRLALLLTCYILIYASQVAVQRVISEQEGMESIFHEQPLQPEVQRDPQVDVNPADQR